MSVNDNIMDIRVRFHRDESPMLFRALSAMESAPGVRTRNQFVRQLIEMGLLMMEERMRRQDGLSTRVPSGLVDELTAPAMAMTRTFGLPAATQAGPEAQAAPGTDRTASADPAPVTSVRTPVAASPASTAAESARPEPTQAPAPAPQFAAVAAPVAAHVPPGDDDRPPPRVGAVRAVRMLDGESFE
jgi:hypothetical protein